MLHNTNNEGVNAYNQSSARPSTALPHTHTHDDMTVDSPGEEPTSSSANSQRRHILSNAVQKVGDRANEVIRASKESSPLISLTLDAMGFIVAPVANRCSTFGGPILDSIDDQLDSVMNKLSETRISDSVSWFTRVDEILSSDSESDIEAGGAVEETSRPAHWFYQIALDVFSRTTRFSEFLNGLKCRLGDTWDDRLTQPASVFFTTAQAARNFVKFGKNTVTSVVDYMGETIDYAVEKSDDCVEAWLPNHELTKNEINVDDGTMHQIRTSDHKNEAKFQQEGNWKKRRRVVSELACKVGRRVKQRLANWDFISCKIKQRLSESYWFNKVDEILLQNPVLQSLKSVMRPAEHFYDTSMSCFVENKGSLEGFISALRTKLGTAWDDRLVDHATEFYESATEESESELSDYLMHSEDPYLA